MNRTHCLWGLALCLFFASCSNPVSEKIPSADLPTAADYPDNVGDIAFDPEIDKADFELCQVRIYQYYNFGDGVKYEGERPAMLAHFDHHYSPTTDWDGYVSIRFVVNCEGGTDRFRMHLMDYDYIEQEGSNEVADALLTAVKAMKGWLTKDFDGEVYPYYQYLTFRIEEGRISEITP